MTRRALATATLGSLLLGACASAPVRLTPVEDFAFPTPERGSLRARDAQRMEIAWRELVRGKTASAESKFRKLAGVYPRAAAPQAGVGYARLRADRLDLAADAFGSALARNPRYVPALIGAATTARRRGDAETAVELYRRALDLDPSAPSIVRRRLGEAKLEVTEHRVQAARRAQSAGNLEAAVEELRRALRTAPEVAGVRLSLADLLAEQGDNAAAIELLAQEPNDDRQVMLRLGKLLREAGEPDLAVAAYERALAREPGDDELRRLAGEAGREAELRRMPEEYRRIFATPRLTRADLAALLDVKVTALGRAPGADPPVATDISGSWARDHILRLLGLGVLEVFPNHTFQPATTVRRADMAQAVSRVLDLLGRPVRPAPVLVDVPAASLHHDAAARAVAEGLMDVSPEGRFDPWRAVSGPEAVLIIEALARGVGP